MNKIALLIGILCAMVTGFLVWQRLDAAEKRMAAVTYLAFDEKADQPFLNVGQEIKADDIGSISLPNGYDIFGLGTKLIEDTPENRTFIVGRKLNSAIPKGRVLTFDLFDDLSATRLDQIVSAGMRAVSLPVSNTGSLNSRVVPGNRIDLAGVIEDQQPPVAEMILEDVRVLAVGDVLSYEEFKGSDSRNYTNITIEVTPEQGLQLAGDRIRVAGELLVMLRNQCDSAATNSTC